MSNTFRFSRTCGNGAWNEQFHQTVLLRPGDTENRVINLFPEITYQTFDGFGCAITEAAGSTYNQMDERQKQKDTRAREEARRKRLAEKRRRRRNRRIRRIVLGSVSPVPRSASRRNLG